MCSDALGRLESHALTTDIVVMGSAAVTSLMLHEVGRRFTVRIEVMRQRDEQQRAALEHLLADLRTQLTDRQQAEAEGARLREPLAHVLLVPGSTLEQDAQSCLEDGALGFVDKPSSVESLTGAVAQALRKTAPRGMSQRVRVPRPATIDN